MFRNINTIVGLIYVTIRNNGIRFVVVTVVYYVSTSFQLFIRNEC